MTIHLVCLKHRTWCVRACIYICACAIAGWRKENGVLGNVSCFDLQETHKGQSFKNDVRPYKTRAWYLFHESYLTTDAWCDSIYAHGNYNFGLQSSTINM